MSKLQRGLALAAFLAVCGVSGCFPIELSVSPDGTIAIPRAEGFCVYDPGKGTVKNIYAPKGEKAAFAQFSPDGKLVLAVRTGKGGGMGQGFVAAVLPASGGAPKEIFTASNITYAQWSPDGKAVAFTRVADSKVAPLEENLPELILANPADGTSKKLLSNTSTIHRWLGDSKSILVMQIGSKGKSGSNYAGKLVKVDLVGGAPKPLAAVVSDNKMFFHLSPDGAKVLFTAVKAGKATDALDANAQGEPQLFELTVATGAVRSVNPKAAYAIYSPKGTKVLVGSAVEGEDGGMKLEVFDASLAKGVTVATDAAKNAGDGMQSVDIHPGWLDEGNVLYLRQHAVYGKDARNFELISVDPQGAKRKNHQPVIENNLKD